MQTSRMTAAAAVVVFAGTAQAAFDTTLYSVNFDPNAIGTQIASLDIASTSYGFPIQAGTTTSGYVDDGPLPGTFLDKTELVSNVYRVTQQTQLSPSLTLNVGDNIFAYTIRLVNQSSNTIDSMFQFQAAGSPFLVDGGGAASDELMGSFLKGFAFDDGGGAANSPLNDPLVSKFDNWGAGIGGKVDYSWDTSNAAAQLDNGQTITMYLFSSPSSIGDGWAAMTASPVNGNIDPNAEFMPILIPIIPAPGSAVLIGSVFGMAALRRRR